MEHYKTIGEFFLSNHYFKQNIPVFRNFLNISKKFRINRDLFGYYSIIDAHSVAELFFFASNTRNRCRAKKKCKKKPLISIMKMYKPDNDIVTSPCFSNWITLLVALPFFFLLYERKNKRNNQTMSLCSR